MIRAAALIVFALPALAQAAHPFVTEDPGTQGKGHYELELGFGAFTGDPSIPGRSYTFAPQLSIGVLEDVDLIAQAVAARQWQTDGPVTSAIAATALLDVKWRFKETEGYALAVRAGLDLPVGDANDGIGSEQLGAHAIAIVSLTLGEYVAYANAAYAYTRAPNTRRNLGGFSIALTRPENRPMRGFVEVATFSNTDPANPQWRAFARTGAIYSPTSWLDVDAGVQARLNRAAARNALLIGATVHW